MASATAKQDLRNDLLYVDIIMEWDRLMNLADWTKWSSDWFHAGDPGMRKIELDRLHDVKTYVFTRVWPGTNQEIEKAFENFRYILNDLLRLFMHFCEERPKESEWLYFARFYKRGGRFNLNYDRDHSDYVFYTTAFEDLGLELTRSANRICDIVRSTIQPQYRRAEGALIVMLGPNMQMLYVNHRPEYRAGEDYNGLLSFYSDRKTRDLCLIYPEDQEPENPWP